ncbi:hypothetical protein [Chitinophaga costaii]|uniref:hypothetical protein n=1 Tax=Chitinophaga costaii TaxID=1335309 RepID=UPI002936E19D|nr:hypothetical protein [Chitinophaga costaii]
MPLTDKEFEVVLSHFTHKKFRKHQFLVQEGNYVDNDFLLQYPTLLQRVPKTFIAAYLGVSRETLSRLSSAV